MNFLPVNVKQRCFEGQGPEGEEKLIAYWNICTQIALVESVRHLPICVVKMLMHVWLHNSQLNSANVIYTNFWIIEK